MIEVDDERLSYYEQCIEQERIAADAATSERTRNIHLRLMRRYEERLAAIRHWPHQPRPQNAPDQMI